MSATIPPMSAVISCGKVKAWTIFKGTFTLNSCIIYFTDKANHINLTTAPTIIPITLFFCVEKSITYNPLPTIIKGIMRGNPIMPTKNAITGVKRPIVTPDHMPTVPAAIKSIVLTIEPVISWGIFKSWNIKVMASKMAVLVMNFVFTQIASFPLLSGILRLAMFGSG